MGAAAGRHREVQFRARNGNEVTQHPYAEVPRLRLGERRGGVESGPVIDHVEDGVGILRVERDGDRSTRSVLGGIAEAFLCHPVNQPLLILLE